MLQRAGREIESTVQGSCMGSALPDGVTIRIRCDPERDWPVGTPVAVLNGTNLLAHRVVYRSGREPLRHYVLTQGDHSILCDAPMHRSMILGEVTSWNDGGRWRPVGSRSPAPLHRGILGRAYRSLIIVCMNVHVGAARSISRGALWLKQVVTGSAGT
jgi:hypothetical protein